MSDTINWLLTIVYRGGLLRCALQVKRDTLTDYCIQNPMEPENLETIQELLPAHVRSCGPLVAVEPIFEICIVEGGEDDG